MLYDLHLSAQGDETKATQHEHLSLANKRTQENWKLIKKDGGRLI